ncbi:hypothetical protein GQ42DRAFT_162762 [Ramicandelaber brevisporus]|nr:hypothetical protein GQ42DRAFT_162762 [Ramicandelaber brevisporus]
MSEPVLELQPHYLCYDVVEYIIETCFDPYTPCVCSLVCKSWNKIVNVIKSRHQRRSEKAFNERYVSRYKARQALSLSQKKDLDRELFNELKHQLSYGRQNFDPAAVRSLLDQGATTCLFDDHEGSTNLGEFVDQCLKHDKRDKNRENGFKVLIDICCSYSREWLFNRRCVGDGGEMLSVFVLRTMASNNAWGYFDVPQIKESIKMRRYVSMVLDSMYMSIKASKMVKPENTMFTKPDTYGLSDLFIAFFHHLTYPQSREERFMIRRFLSYALNAIDTLSKSKDLSSLVDKVLHSYTMCYRRYRPIDPRALEWIFKIFMELGYFNLVYLIIRCGYRDPELEFLGIKSMNWSKFLYARGSRRALSKFVETYKDMRVSILLDENGTWWKMLVRDKNRHLLKRLHDLETESFNTSGVLEYARSKEVKGKKEHLIEILEMLEIANE